MSYVLYCFILFCLIKNQEKIMSTTTEPRPRGRPKKVDNTTLIATEPRPRGRPKKIDTNTTETIAEVKEQKSETPATTPQPQKLASKLVVITGATSGMGLKILEELITRSDIEIIAVGRKPQLCRDIVLKTKSTYPDAKLHFMVTDLSLINQTNELINDIIQKVTELGYDRIDTLFLNAGLMTQKVELTYEGNEKQWATNYLSPVLMLEKLFPLLQKSTDARVIFVTNNKAKHTKINWKALREPRKFTANTLYNQSKLALLIYALEFHYRQFNNPNFRMLVVNPGKVKTKLTTKETKGLKKLKNIISNWTACSIQEGIRTAHYLITADTLPHNVVCYQNMRAVMPNTYCMNSDNRYKLFNATRRMLDLPALNRVNEPLEDDIPLSVLPEWR